MGPFPSPIRAGGTFRRRAIGRSLAPDPNRFGRTQKETPRRLAGARGDRRTSDPFRTGWSPPPAEPFGGDRRRTTSRRTRMSVLDLRVRVLESVPSRHRERNGTRHPSAVSRSTVADGRSESFFASSDADSNRRADRDSSPEFASTAICLREGERRSRLRVAKRRRRRRRIRESNRRRHPRLPRRSYSPRRGTPSPRRTSRRRHPRRR